MHFLIAGASGFLGSGLRERLARDGHTVTRLVRGEPGGPSESRWDPASKLVDRQVVEEADVVVNLAGASFYRWPLTETYKRAFRASRVDTTRVLADAIAASDRKPVFLAQNGTSYYGDRGDELLSEDSPEGDDGTFLNAITKDWEAATHPASAAGARVCVMRTSAVLHRAGGAFKPLLLLFRLGLGGPIGDGRQYFPTISLNDWVRAVRFLAEDPTCTGAYNLTGPNPTTNAEFVAELGRMVHRPTALRVPATPLRRIFPELSPELLGSVRAVPKRLEEAGFAFDQPTLNERLASALTH